MDWTSSTENRSIIFPLLDLPGLGPMITAHGRPGWPGRGNRLAFVHTEVPLQRPMSRARCRGGGGGGSGRPLGRDGSLSRRQSPSPLLSVGPAGYRPRLSQTRQVTSPGVSGRRRAQTPAPAWTPTEQRRASPSTNPGTNTETGEPTQTEPRRLTRPAPDREHRTASPPLPVATTGKHGLTLSGRQNRDGNGPTDR